MARGIDETWRRLTGPRGFVGSDDWAWLQAGDRVTLTGPGGEALSGNVLLFHPGRALALITEQYGQGLFRVHADRAGGQSMVFIGCSAWGAPAPAVDGFKARAERALAETLSVEIA